MQHALDADQARTRDSFGYEWTKLYPEHGHSTPEWQAERDIFLEYTRSVPSDFKGRLVLDGGCGNGRYAKLANDWGARVVAVDISDAVEIASVNVADRPGVDVVQADLFRLPFRPDTFDAAYSVGVLHHTPDAKGAFMSIKALVKPGGWFGIFIHAQGNRVLYFMNRTLRSWTSRASYRTTWNFSLGAHRRRQGSREDSDGRARCSTSWAGRCCSSRPISTTTSTTTAPGFASFHRKEEIRGWYGDWDDVAVRYAGVATESIYARGRRP